MVNVKCQKMDIKVKGLMKQCLKMDFDGNVNVPMFKLGVPMWKTLRRKGLWFVKASFNEVSQMALCPRGTKTPTEKVINSSKKVGLKSREKKCVFCHDF